MAALAEADRLCSVLRWYLNVLILESIGLKGSPVQDKQSKNHTHNRFTALWNLSGKTRVSRYQKKHSPTTLIVVINHPYPVVE